MEDYISQMEWENTHPPDQRGRPSLKYQPNWKYKRVYPRTKQLPVYVWIILAVVFGIPMGLMIFLDSERFSGERVFILIIFLCLAGIFFYFSKKPK